MFEKKRNAYKGHAEHVFLNPQTASTAPRLIGLVSTILALNTVPMTLEIATLVRRETLN